MPSARTTRPLAASEAIEFSLCERTIPGSVQLAISIAWVRSMCGSVRFRGRRHAQRLREFLAGLVTLVGILGHRAREERDQSRGKAGNVRANVGRRLVGDLEHQLRHRFALEGQ